MCDDLRQICSNCARIVPATEKTSQREGVFEWEIPSLIRVSWNSGTKQGFRMQVRIKGVRDNLLSSPWKTYSFSSSNPYEAMKKGIEILHKYRFTLDPQTVRALVPAAGVLVHLDEHPHEIHQH